MINNFEVSLKIGIAYLLEKYLKSVFNFFSLMKKVEFLLFVQVLLFVEDTI
jgi:hypothetical protein